MLLSSINRFLHKTRAQRKVTVRFFVRRGVSKLPFLPVRIRLTFHPGETASFWWSYLPSADHPDRGLLDFWGDDVGELRFLWNVLKADSSFMDVGAYHGIYSLIAGMKIQEGGRIVAFEPSVRERRRMRLHLRMNGISSVTLEPYAVGALNGESCLFTVLSGFTSMNSLRPPAAEFPIRPVPVKTISLDAYLQSRGIHRLDVIKLDTEGGELEVLRGAPRMLEGVRPMIICEVLDWVTGPWGYAARDIVTHLQCCEYQWFDFQPDGSLTAHQPKDSYPEVRNYLAVPVEKLNAVQVWMQ